MDTMSLISEGTFDAACSAVDAAVHAGDLVLDGQRAAYAAVRPPGHHAGPAFYGGSCYFNNAAAAAQRLRDGGVERVAIVDIDAHQGNGTQEIFWERGDVLYASVHVDPAAGWFPHLVGHADERGGGDGEGATVNEPIPPGSGDEPWLAALGASVRRRATARTGRRRRVARRRCRRRRSGGAADGHGRRLRGGRRALAALGVPTVFVQEGGYDLPRLGPLVLAVLDGFERV